MTLLTVTLEHYLVVSALLLVTGLVGIAMGRKSIITILMSLELMLLSVNINLVAFSAHLKDITGQAMGLFVLTVAAAEAAIGLAILLTCYRNRGTVDIEDLSTLKG